MTVVRTIRLPYVNANSFARHLSDSAKNGKRFLQTIPSNDSRSEQYIPLNYSIDYQNKKIQETEPDLSKLWSKHSLPSPTPSPSKAPIRKSRVQRLSNVSNSSQNNTVKSTESNQSNTSSTTPTEKTILTTTASTTAPTTATNNATPAKKPRRALRPRKALISLSANAITHLQELSNQPDPKLIRIGVKNRGCSGLSYDLEYVSQPGKFDELIEQDGVKVLIDSKAIFSIVGSEMDWIDDKLSSKFIFKNPNSKGTCGCGESFMV